MHVCMHDLASYVINTAAFSAMPSLGACAHEEIDMHHIDATNPGNYTSDDANANTDTNMNITKIHMTCPLCLCWCVYLSLRYSDSCMHSSSTLRHQQWCIFCDAEYGNLCLCAGVSTVLIEYAGLNTIHQAANYYTLTWHPHVDVAVVFWEEGGFCICTSPAACVIQSASVSVVVSMGTSDPDNKNIPHNMTWIWIQLRIHISISIDT